MLVRLLNRHLSEHSIANYTEKTNLFSANDLNRLNCLKLTISLKNVLPTHQSSLSDEENVILPICYFVFYYVLNCIPSVDVDSDQSYQYFSCNRAQICSNQYCQIIQVLKISKTKFTIVQLYIQTF